MDERRFDKVVQELALKRGRRAFARAVLTALVLIIPRRRAQAAAQSGCPDGCAIGDLCMEGSCGQACETDRDCRNKHDDPCMSNTCAEGLCRSAIADCIPGYECCKGECCPKSCDLDEECAVFDPCRRGECAPDGFCFFTVYEPCELCTSDLDCAAVEELNTICCSGMCKRPCPVGTMMGKGCECRADSSGIDNGLIVRDDASGCSENCE